MSREDPSLLGFIHLKLIDLLYSEVVVHYGVERQGSNIIGRVDNESSERGELNQSNTRLIISGSRPSPSLEVQWVQCSPSLSVAGCVRP